MLIFSATALSQKSPCRKSFSYKATPSAMKQLPYKKDGLSWGEQYTCILPSQCIWNLPR